MLVIKVWNEVIELLFSSCPNEEQVADVPKVNYR